MRSSWRHTPRASPQVKETMRFGARVRVLVVDDEPSICKALEISLTRSGYEVVTAQSGEAALAILRGEHVDVLLIDLRIPDMRGDIIFEVGVGHQPHLRHQTLFMTGDITERGEQLIAACNCNYLSKPFDLTVMTDAVVALSPQIHDRTA